MASATRNRWVNHYSIRLCFALLLSSAEASTAEQAPRYQQAILIVLDAARPDHFSCYGYPKPTTPEIDKLAARGAVFRDGLRPGNGDAGVASPDVVQPVFHPRDFPQPPFDPLRFARRPFPEKRRPGDLPAPGSGSEGVATAAISAHEWITEQIAVRPGIRLSFRFAVDHSLRPEIRVSPGRQGRRSGHRVDREKPPPRLFPLSPRHGHPLPPSVRGGRGLVLRAGPVRGKRIS